MALAAETILNGSGHQEAVGRPWLGRQSWKHMALAHWAVAPQQVQALLPAGLEVDTCGDSAWVSVVAYRMEDVRLRGMPAALAFNFPQLNLRTYVRFRGQLGIYFFSLDASSRLAVTAGRAITGLPYHRAQMRMRQERDATRFSSARAGAPHGVEVQYTAGEPIVHKKPLDLFLTERYVFFSAHGSTKLYAGEVRHAPWALCAAQVTFSSLTLAEGFPSLQEALRRKPDYHQYSPGVDVLFWRPLRVA